MKFQVIYRASFYAMLTCATLVMSIDATDDNPIAMLYPWAVALAGVAALVTVDRDPGRGISRGSANVLAFASIGLSYLEYRYDENLLLLALGHWLIYLLMVKLFLPKTVEDDWFLITLGLVLVLIGGVLSQSDQVGIALFSWAFLSLWVLGLFSLKRDAARVRQPSGVTVTPAMDPEAPYPGLVDRSFVLAAFRVALTTLALGGVIFLAMPRQASMAASQRGDLPAKHLTGFDDEVELGQLGEILENDSVVMNVELFDDKGQRAGPLLDPLWRGVTMVGYRSGRWSRERYEGASFAIDLRHRRGTRPTLRQQIRMEPNDRRILFGLRPLLDATAGRRSPEFNSIDGSIVRSESRSGTYDYQVISAVDGDLDQPGEIPIDANRMARLLLVPPAIRQQLRAIVEPLVRDIPPEDWVARGRALEAYLRNSDRFSYTLQMSTVNPDLDPVIDFLTERKAGHCEYFASALALMLRSADIPSRLVNGFKGGDWNDLSRSLTVRQKHAHSWVEMLGPSPDDDPLVPIWITLDPTPPAPREASVARVGGFRANFRQFTDFVRYVWIFYVVGFNAERQKLLIYDPALKLFGYASRGFTLIWSAARGGLARLLNFPSVESFFSVRGLFVSFFALLTLAGLARISFWLARLAWRAVRGTRRDDSPAAVGVAIYRRLAEILAGFGLDRPPAETPSEFARRAASFLAARGSDTVAVADVPSAVVDAFYRIRFGRIELPAVDIEALETRLDALERTIKPARA